MPGLTAQQLQDLKTELDTDPTGKGYADMPDPQAKANLVMEKPHISNPVSQPNIPKVDSDELGIVLALIPHAEFVAVKNDIDGAEWWEKSRHLASILMSDASVTDFINNFGPLGKALLSQATVDTLTAFQNYPDPSWESIVNGPSRSEDLWGTPEVSVDFIDVELTQDL
jgi:hypothetical protein